MSRGDVILVQFPHPSGARGKKRPAVVVQSDAYAGHVRTVVCAEVTTNLTMASDAACLFIDLTTPEGKATGLLTESVVSCLLLVLVYEDTVSQVLGTLSPALLARLDNCLQGGAGPALSSPHGSSGDQSVMSNRECGDDCGATAAS